MSTLPELRLIELLAPYLGDLTVPSDLYSKLSRFLDLLLRWNARTNLTAIRDPEQIVLRHFGESLFCGVTLASRIPPDGSLLDFGSGAGFPGLPIQLLLPNLRVTLGESQNKKASFLREAIRTLELPHTEVWAKRVEDLPPATIFNAVTLRAVDNMESALTAARPRVIPGGYLAALADSTTGAALHREHVAGPGHLVVTLEQM